MSYLLLAIAVVVVFLIIQLIRVFELTGKLRNSDEYSIKEGPNRNRALGWALFGIGYFVFFIWLAVKYGPMMLPEAASAHGESIDLLFDINWVILITAFVITHIVLFYFVNVYYWRANRKADFITHNNKLELVWTVVPAIALAVIVIYGLRTWNEVTGDMTASDDAIKIELYAKQFDWTARYGGNDNNLGVANFNFINTSNPLGLINKSSIAIRLDELKAELNELEEDLTKAPKDGKKERAIKRKIQHRKDQVAAIYAMKRNIEVNGNGAYADDDKLVKLELHIPVNKPVNIQMRSQDVIHSALMPHFRAQMNCVPGMVTNFNFTPTITTEEMKKKTGNPDFEYILLCNKICGTAHYNMQMNIIVEPEEEYLAWYGEQKTFNDALMAAHPEYFEDNLADNQSK
ncbi:MAG TPA: cytochrome C oxidase subunit II [Flavobacteriales bacterium]|jgi:cytochrome c oxidase subunit 2|nr:cytochrome C oxidase subunit II [Flavobacteriales bacterium]